MSDDLCISVDAVAIAINLRRAQVMTLVRRKQIPFVRLPNGEIRFRPDDVREWIAALPNEGKTEPEPVGAA